MVDVLYIQQSSVCHSMQISTLNFEEKNYGDDALNLPPPPILCATLTLTPQSKMPGFVSAYSAYISSLFRVVLISNVRSFV